MADLPRLPPKIGLLDSFVRNAAKAATFDTANNVAAAANATIPMGGAVSQAPSWMERYQQDLAAQRALDLAAEQQHGHAWDVGEFAGWGLNPVQKFIPNLQGILGLQSSLPSMLSNDLTAKRRPPAQGGLFASAFQPGGILARFNDN